MKTYVERIFEAETLEEQTEILEEAVEQLSEQINSITHFSSPKDYPVVIAALEMAADTIRAIVGRSGCEIADKIKKNLVGIATPTGGDQK